MTQAQANILLFEQAVMATCAVLTLVSAARAAVKVKSGVDDAKDFIEGAKRAL